MSLEDNEANISCLSYGLIFLGFIFGMTATFGFLKGGYDVVNSKDCKSWTQLYDTPIEQIMFVYGPAYKISNRLFGGCN